MLLVTWALVGWLVGRQTILFLATNTSLAKFAGQKKMTPQQSSKRCEALATAAFEDVRVFGSNGNTNTFPGITVITCLHAWFLPPTVK